MRRRSWTERQLGGVSSDGGGVVLMVVMMMLIVKKRIMMMVVVVKLLMMVKLMFFFLQKSCRRIACCAAPGVSRDLLLFRQVQKSINQRDTVLKKVDVKKENLILFSETVGDQ